MADIVFKPKFTHEDWIDNEDLVQADGEKGFNVRFNAIEEDLGEIGKVVAAIAAEFQKQVHLAPVAVFSETLAADQITDPKEVETYATPKFSEGLRKVYQVAIEPFGTSHPHVSHQFVYTEAPSDQTKVSVWFRNEKSVAARVTAKVFALV